MGYEYFRARYSSPQEETLGDKLHSEPLSLSADLRGSIYHVQLRTYDIVIVY